MPNDKISKITLPDGTTYDIQDTTYSAGTGLSLSGTVINHSNSVTAQTTQAIYPITIDAQGHIGSYGNAASIPTKTSDLTNDSGFITGMTILSYGSSTWADFIAAYDVNKVVYCRASSNANPASGSQTRLAFMAYVNNATTPTNVEFQYYRSVGTHTEAQQGDQVFVYKLDKTSGWSVTTREASVKVAYNNGITGTYSNGVMTLKHANAAITAQPTQAVYPIAIDAYGHITGYGSAVTIPEIPSVTASDNGKILTVVNGAWDANNANFIPGIESETYEIVFGGEFTVTTATDAEHEHPYANTGIIESFKKCYAYRVTFDGVQYFVPLQVFANQYGSGTMITHWYVGDISLYYEPMDGLLNDPQSVPFLIASEYDGVNNPLYVYTTVAGEHTFLIEEVDASYEKIPSDLIYGNVCPPFQYMIKSVNSALQGFSVGSNRFITTNNFNMPMYAFGYGNIVSGTGDCAIGFLNKASKTTSMAFGFLNEASAGNSMAFGSSNKASGNSSMAFGNGCEASGPASMAFGNGCESSSYQSMAFGASCKSSGSQSMAFGYHCEASGNRGSFANGALSIASGARSHADGDGCRAAATGSHVEGGGTYANESQNYVHVGGVNNAVSTETGKTVDITRYNGDGTVFNTSTHTLGKYAEVIGNGDSDQARSNARTLDWDGNEAIAGSLTLGLGTVGEITLTPAQLATVLASLLPAVSASDNGKVLTVVNGAWAAADLPTYQGGVS